MKPIPQHLTPLKIHDREIKFVNSTVFLGLNLNQNLSWKNHIDYVISKINKIRGILYVTRGCFTSNSLRLIYLSLIYPHLNYCNIIWGNTTKNNLKPLEVAQKNIIRTIMHRPRFFHTNDDFVYLKLLKLKEINILNSCNFVYKSLNNLVLLSIYFTLSFNFNYNLRTPDITIRTPLVGFSRSQKSPAFPLVNFGTHCPRRYFMLIPSRFLSIE